TKIWGAHTMKFGVDLRRIHFIEQNSGDILQFEGRTQFTQRIFNQAEPTAGDAFASFLLGGVNGSLNYPLYPFTRAWYVAPYFQDDWKVSRKLTLNLGVRWDYNGAPDEKYNRLNRGFNPDAPSPIAGQIPANMLALYPHLQNLRGGLEFAGVNGNPTTAWNADWNNWQPRVGAAFQITERLVMRGGYGLYFLNPNNDARRFVGFSTNTPLVNSLDDGRTLLPNLLVNPYPNGINQPVGSSLGYLQNVGQNLETFFPGYRTPKYHSFSYGFQFQPSQNSTIDASYVGSRSQGLNDEREINHPSPEFRAQCNIFEGGSPAFCNEQLPNPFRGIEAFRGTSLYTANTMRRYDLMRPYPQYGNNNMLMRGLNTSKIWYNSLQLNYNHRLRSGLTLLANYTLSKMVERFGYDDPVRGIPGQGLYFNDRPHYLKFSTVWELPFGQGRAIGGGATGFLNKLISGWQLSTFTQTASGEPNNLNPNVIQIRDPRKTIAGDWNGDVDWNQHRIVGWNPCVLRQNNDGTITPQPFSIARGCGTDTSNYAWLRVSEFAANRNSPRRSGQIRKQPTFNVDLSVSKMTQITERVRFQFRAEAFNATNYFYFGRDSNFTDNPDDANFGTIFQHLAWTGNGYPRQIQLGFKVLF
ncbi:MAG TPA: TonB-dependent receptor, partial [Bryobacteraceae bacterium]|nr:TonB-dependent receptor [Bryobacteraceae bacterium]